MRKKLITSLISALFIPASYAQTLIGDMNNDGKLTVEDISLLVNAVMDFSEMQNEEAIDLNLPSGTLWAKHNLGALEEEEFGDYFAWAETSTKTYYSWSNYKWVNANNKTWAGCNKYTCADGQTQAGWYSDFAFIGDGLYILEEEDDPANKMKSNWRMPTQEEIQELIDECNWTWTSYNRVNGYIIKGTNNNEIFLPAAGNCISTLFDTGIVGKYWASKLSVTHSEEAISLEFNRNRHFLSTTERYEGLSIRPVCKKK